jgi:hypothetical protein
MQDDAHPRKAELSLYIAVVPGCPAGGGYCANICEKINNKLTNKTVRKNTLFIKL